jgi:hypothetical protein
MDWYVITMQHAPAGGGKLWQVEGAQMRLVEHGDETLDEAPWEPLSPEVQAALDGIASEGAMLDARSSAISEAREGLQNAIDLMALNPFPTPEEQAVVDATVAEALTLYRAAADPPGDLVALAAALISTKVG